MTATGRKLYRIDLTADGRADAGIGDALRAGTAAAGRVRKRSAPEGPEAALGRRAQKNPRPRLLDGAGEARLAVPGLFASAAGPGATAAEAARRKTGRAESCGEHFLREGSAGFEKNEIRPWAVKRWCIPEKESEDFVDAMEDVLDAYAREYGDDEVLVCADETSVQQTAEARRPLPAAPGKPAVCDYEYARDGTANLFMTVAPIEGLRHVKVTDRCAKRDFAQILKDMADIYFPDRKIILVTADPDTHKLSALYAAFDRKEAHRIRQRFEVRYAPKHGRWLNIAEIEINALSAQCLRRRIPDRETLVSEVAAWEKSRNAAGKSVNQWFRTEDARVKLNSLYPSIQ